MKARRKYSEGCIVINMASECEPEDDEMEDEPEEMAKGGMVRAKKKTAQIKGWGKARRR